MITLKKYGSPFTEYFAGDSSLPLTNHTEQAKAVSITGDPSKFINKLSIKYNYFVSALIEGAVQ